MSSVTINLPGSPLEWFVGLQTVGFACLGAAYLVKACKKTKQVAKKANKPQSSAPRRRLSVSSTVPDDLSDSIDDSLTTGNMTDVVRQLEARNQELQRALTLTSLSNVTAQDANAGMKMTPAEIETLRAIFNMFDRSGSGSVRSDEIKQLHAKLGESITDDEAHAFATELDPEGRGSVSFTNFLVWYYQQHKRGKRSSGYQQRFKLLSAKLLNSEFNMDRIVMQVE